MSEYIMERRYDIKNGTFSTIKHEEIVRCRDCCCMHRMDGRRVCIRWQFATAPDGFCAWGERREDGDGR